MTVAVDALKETPPGETLVAVTPASVQRLRASGIDVLVERTRVRVLCSRHGHTPTSARASTMRSS